MNWDLVEPVLSELLEDTRALKKELQEQRQVLEALRSDLATAQEKAGGGPQTAAGLEAASVKQWISEALAELQKAGPPPRPAPRSWTLFSSDFQAHNFQVVFETVCKWLGILLGGACLLYFVFTRWS